MTSGPRDRDQRPRASGALLAALVLGSCGWGFERRLAYHVLDSTTMHRPMELAVWTPPGPACDGERLPIVLFLHAGGGDAASLDRAGLGRLLDDAARAGRIPRAVIVVPQGELGLWANWHDGTNRYEDWAVDEAMAWVARRHPTASCPDGCHVMGVSMGGNGALAIALHRPGRFATATVISAEVLDADEMVQMAQNPLFVPYLPMDRIYGPTSGDAARAGLRREDPYQRIRAPSDLGGTRWMIAWGRRDRGRVRATSRRFVAHLRARGIEHEALEYDGDHSWRSWNAVVEEALRRMVGPPGPPCPSRPRGDALSRSPSEGG